MVKYCNDLDQLGCATTTDNLKISAAYIQRPWLMDILSSHSCALLNWQPAQPYNRDLENSCMNFLLSQLRSNRHHFCSHFIGQNIHITLPTCRRSGKYSWIKEILARHHFSAKVKAKSWRSQHRYQRFLRFLLYSCISKEFFLNFTGGKTKSIIIYLLKKY